MADTDRLSFLPMIKCSSCAVDIEISRLADHVCAATPSDTMEPASPKIARAATFDSPSFTDDAPSQLKPVRMRPPPRIDPSVASRTCDPTHSNKPFKSQINNPLSPGSNYSDYLSPSPLSPRPPFKMARSATSPMPRSLAPPSPDLPSNMDCAFPPFPASRSGTPTSADARPKEKTRPTYKHRYANADPLYAPLSPRTNGGENVAKRMDSIAPGPFDGRGGDSRPSTSEGRSGSGQTGQQFGHRRTATQGSTRSDAGGLNQRTSLASNASRTSTFSHGSVGLPARPKLAPGAAGTMGPPPLPSQAEGIDAFLDRLQKETIQGSKVTQESRSRTFPLRQDSEEATGYPVRPRRPSQSNGLTRSATDGDMSDSKPRPNNMFPVRSSSRAGSKAGPRLSEAPPLPPIPPYAKDLPSNPLHTPSDSGLSDDSISSAGLRSAASSRSSPPASEASGQHSRNASKVGRLDYMNEEIVPRVASPESFLDPRTPPKPEKRNGSGYSRGRAPEPLGQSLVQPPPPLFADLPESPLDPAIQRGLLFQKPVSSQPPFHTDPAVNSRSPPRRVPDPEPRARPERRPTTASKGRCRGCSEPIVGKSVKDSSGRLTGRYHKQCFVCRTCQDPFPSAEFYVFDNSPYCEHHYHKLNGSLCLTCNRGIEGQYLETDQRNKFHPRCFSCFTCRIILRDEYYEVSGKAYCERHAYAAQKSNISLAPGGFGFRNNNLQKRRTRLMMMS
ncbi:hypothetical protein K491DRAFT_590561 [Lophiostoma macrostomum CBS 122681]|uniref:LIM zinc-binding domain-containing protein n=1 Tax=Lophiostoma macrostomum CBS 122681 TaxID=1314788 RepID=A0A6A6TI29_9PLEO|nr:hypothetical protein K491DRAFT_590561 [Lophiostoma macrostomum CBS 122681]